MPFVSISVIAFTFMLGFVESIVNSFSTVSASYTFPTTSSYAVVTTTVFASDGMPTVLYSTFPLCAVLAYFAADPPRSAFSALLAATCILRDVASVFNGSASSLSFATYSTS